MQVIVQRILQATFKDKDPHLTDIAILLHQFDKLIGKQRLPVHPAPYQRLCAHAVGMLNVYKRLQEDIEHFLRGIFTDFLQQCFYVIRDCYHLFYLQGFKRRLLFEKG
ncbi:hypothetical protein D3C75_747030 [compost metagenome]